MERSIEPFLEPSGRRLNDAMVRFNADQNLRHDLRHGGEPSTAARTLTTTPERQMPDLHDRLKPAEPWYN
jgi:hypothetical protein